MMRRVVLTIILATVLWTVMFSPWTAPHVNFWWMMTASACSLTLLSSLFAPGWWKRISITPSNIFYGILIAVALWGVFWLGDKFSQLLFDFARPQVDTIYGMKDGESPWLLTVLLLFLIGQRSACVAFNAAATATLVQIAAEVFFQDIETD